MKTIKQKFASLVGLATLTLGAPAIAGGPLAVCEPGVPYLWANGGTDITFNPDQGDLGPVGAAAAVALVSDAFQAWEDIPSSTLSYQAGALLPVDVDITNFDFWLNAPAPDGLSAVVFDDDGQIFDLLFGPGSGILGFAGPEWGTPANCTIDEGYSFLNGPSFTNSTAAFDVMVHEFGHWTNFAHTVVNGQLYIGEGDTTGPNPNNTFGDPPFPPIFPIDIVETMYPFYFGPGIGTGSPEADDIAIASRMYPEPNYASTTGEISGSVLLGSSGITGVNVIARNYADPFNDAVSAISSDFTDSTSTADPNVGVYRITGLTPGAEYGVYIDEVLAGGFSTTLASPLPGPEEGYNAAESSDSAVDDPSELTPVMVAAGAPNTGIDIIFNEFGEGEPLPVGDEGSVRLSLPFQFCMQGQPYDSVFVNANGHLTFGASAPDFDFFVNEGTFLDGPPRIAGLWGDLNEAAGGQVYFYKTSSSFTVTWDGVPEWPATGANTFDITLYDNSNACVDDDDNSSDDDSSDDKSRDKRGGADVKFTHYSGQLTDAIVGVSGGLPTTSGAEVESDLSALSRNGRKKIDHSRDAAIFENFLGDSGSFDLWGNSVKFKKLGKAFKDKFEKNNSLKKAKKISLPFDTLDTKRRYSAIDPAAADIDFYRFYGEANKYLIADVARGQIDSVLGLFYCPPKAQDDDSSDDDSSDDDSSKGSKKKLDKCDSNTAILVASNDDFNGLLSRIEGTLPWSGTWALAVSFYGDLDFDGVDPGQGLPFDQGRYVLDVQLLDGIPLPVSDDGSVQLSGFGFDIPFAGATYSSVFVNMNGNITFGAANFDFSESIGEFESGPPRAAPLWDDLSPNNGGLVLFSTDFATQLTIKFVDVPEFSSAGANNFSVTLHSSGQVDFDYGSVTATDGLIGATPGNGSVSMPVDLSISGGGDVIDSLVELFDFGNPYDLGNPDSLTFTQ